MDKTNINLGTWEVDLSSRDKVIVRAAELLTAYLALRYHALTSDDNRRLAMEAIMKRIGWNLIVLLDRIGSECDKRPKYKFPIGDTEQHWIDFLMLEPEDVQELMNYNDSAEEFSNDLANLYGKSSLYLLDFINQKMQ